MMMTTRPPVNGGGEWIDPEQAHQRAEHRSRVADKIEALADRTGGWFEAVSAANHFRDRWDEITGRDPR